MLGFQHHNLSSAKRCGLVINCDVGKSSRNRVKLPQLSLWELRLFHPSTSRAGASPSLLLTWGVEKLPIQLSKTQCPCCWWVSSKDIGVTLQGSAGGGQEGSLPNDPAPMSLPIVHRSRQEKRHSPPSQAKMARYLICALWHGAA